MQPIKDMSQNVINFEKIPMHTSTTIYDHFSAADSTGKMGCFIHNMPGSCLGKVAIYMIGSEIFQIHFE